MTEATGLSRAFRETRRHLWGLCYRMTGSAADADDLVQETFAQAVAHPPSDTSRAWRPWLVRVAMNLSRDHLRRRRRQGYVGPYLPGAIEPAAYEHESVAGRYDRLESVSIAFLLALEALTPRRRAVLLLRDVFDYTVAETAVALDLSEASVKTTLHRARQSLRDYDEGRAGRSSPSKENGAKLEALFYGLATGDTARVAALLAEDVRALTDAGGAYRSALKPIEGRDRVLRFFSGLLAKRGLPVAVEPRILNGQPALVAEWSPNRADAPRSVVFIELDALNQVSLVATLLAPRKLAGVTPCAPRR